MADSWRPNEPEPMGCLEALFAAFVLLVIVAVGIGAEAAINATVWEWVWR